MVDIFTNRLIADKMKRRSIVVCLMILGSIFCEWIGVVTNGASASLIGLHKFAKFMEFCLAPCIGVAAAIAYGNTKKPSVAIGVVTAHILFEFIALFNNFIFSVDSTNTYHRESMYWIYILLFTASTIYSFVCIVQGERKYQAKINGVLILTLCFLGIGIAIQMLNPDIRVDFMCVAISNGLFYNHHCKTILQVDMVTHLLNRRCYERGMENIKAPAAILIFDINKFKRINDTYGHAAGDLCLKKVAEKILAVYGRYGLCYRIGGDEFSVILSKNSDNLEILNRRFADEIEQLTEKDRKMSDVAIGYAYYNEDETDVKKVFEEADEMMYKNKKC